MRAYGTRAGDVVMGTPGPVAVKGLQRALARHGVVLVVDESRTTLDALPVRVGDDRLTRRPTRKDLSAP
jgi:hypothetical protein